MRSSRRLLAMLAATLELALSPALAAEIDHSEYGVFLEKYVRNGLVDYRAVEGEDGRLAAYLGRLGAVDPEDFDGWEREAKIALWINAYNAVTIHGIAINYPIEYGGLIARARFPESSIRQIAGFWDTVFVNVVGAEITLNQIEHQILRREFPDPRIHFSLVCASMGCPVLSNDAYQGKLLQRQLERDVRRFINDEDKVRLDRSENRIYVSRIFKWYAEDFRAEEAPQWLQKYPERYRGVMETVARYVARSDRDYMVERAPSLEFLDYDWSLNELDPGVRGEDGAH